jgi:anaerobic C4-dicarboxylate transporter
MRLERLVEDIYKVIIVMAVALSIVVAVASWQVYSRLDYIIHMMEEVLEWDSGLADSSLCTRY